LFEKGIQRLGRASTGVGSDVMVETPAPPPRPTAVQSPSSNGGEDSQRALEIKSPTSAGPTDKV